MTVLKRIAGALRRRWLEIFGDVRKQIEKDAHDAGPGEVAP